MAGGPLVPSSALPGTGASENIGFPITYAGSGVQQDTTTLYGIADATAVVSDDTAWHLVFNAPVSLPAGTSKLIIDSRASATTGICALNVSWANVPLTGSPDDYTFSDEGSVDIDFTVPAAADHYQRTRLTLDGDTIVTGEKIHMDIDVDNSEHTVAVEVGLDLFIIWE
jgi:hypothetical protein